MHLTYKNYFLIGIVIIAIPYMIWLILGGNSYVEIYDCLDSELIYIKLLLESKDPLGLSLTSSVEPIMNGLPRYVFKSGLCIPFLIFSVFPLLTAYIINHCLAHIVGFVGMMLLLRRYFVKGKLWLITVMSLCYGFLGYISVPFGISISGQAILLYAFLNLLYKRHTWFDWLVIVMFPFYSMVVVTLPFYLPVIVSIGVYHYAKTRQWSNPFIFALVLICIVNVVSEYPLLYSTFINSDFITHRVERDKFSIENSLLPLHFIKNIVVNLIYTDYHSGKLYTFLVVFGFIVSYFKYKIKVDFVMKVLLWLIAILLVWDLISDVVLYALRDYVPFLRTFNITRFTFLLPISLLLLLAKSLDKLNFSDKKQYIFAVSLSFVMLFGTMYANRELRRNVLLFAQQDKNIPSFDRFFSVSMMEDIKEYIGSDNVANYNTISVGFYSTVLQYNGFRTLDSYQNNYPLEYKHEFRKIIAGELDKNIFLKHYFDYWGNRCYSFVDEIGYVFMIPEKSEVTIKNLDYDFEQFKKMNGKYVFSAVPIENWRKLGLSFRQKFSSDDSFWDIYLYETKCPDNFLN